MKPLRILFESSEGTLAIEFSRDRGELTLVAIDGERKTITGERGKMITRKAIELTVLCAVGAMPEDEAEVLMGATMNAPRCDCCRKALVWAPERLRRAHGDAAARRRRIRSWRSQRQRTAIRCLWCFRTFCPACARRHFVHTDHAHQAIEKVLVRVSAAMLRGLEKSAGLRGRLLCEKLTRGMKP